MGEPRVFRAEALEHYWTSSRSRPPAGLPRARHGPVAAALALALAGALAVAWKLRVPVLCTVRAVVVEEPGAAGTRAAPSGLVLLVDPALGEPAPGARVRPARTTATREVLEARVDGVVGPLAGEALRAALGLDQPVRGGPYLLAHAAWQPGGAAPPQPGVWLEASLEIGRVRALALVPGLGALDRGAAEVVR